jgi:single-strand DNA-binding protein
MANQLILTGFLGKDPEFKNLENGKAVVRLSVATDDGYKDQKGEWQTNTNWHSVILWNKAATNAKSLRKGDKVFVRGQNTSRTYQTNEGENRHVYEVKGFEVSKLVHERRGETSPLPTEQDKQSKATGDAANTGLTGTGTDNLPF